MTCAGTGACTSVSQFAQTIQNIQKAKPDWILTINVGAAQDSFFEQAAAAWRNAIRTGGASERRLNELGRALVAAADDTVTPEARAAFEKSLEIEPRGVMPRFFLAAALSQEGKKQEAVDAWKAIVSMGTAEDPWLADARQSLAEAELCEQFGGPGPRGGARCSTDR